VSNGCVWNPGAHEEESTSPESVGRGRGVATRPTAWSRGCHATRGDPYSPRPLAAGDGAPAPVQPMCLRPLSPGLATPTVPFPCFASLFRLLGRRSLIHCSALTWKILHVCVHDDRSMIEWHGITLCSPPLVRVHKFVTRSVLVSTSFLLSSLL
jgi:hypothetical protein